MIEIATIFYNQHRFRVVYPLLLLRQACYFSFCKKNLQICLKKLKPNVWPKAQGNGVIFRYCQQQGHLTLRASFSQREYFLDNIIIKVRFFNVIMTYPFKTEFWNPYKPHGLGKNSKHIKET